MSHVRRIMNLAASKDPVTIEIEADGQLSVANNVTKVILVTSLTSSQFRHKMIPEKTIQLHWQSNVFAFQTRDKEACLNFMEILNDYKASNSSHSNTKPKLTRMESIAPPMSGSCHIS